MVDEHLEPVLIEINFSPSLACGTPLDLKTKSHVIADTLSLACVQPYDDVKMKGRIKPKNKKKNSKKGDGGKSKKKSKSGNNNGSGISLSPTNYAVDAKTLASLTPEERRSIAELEAEDRVSNGFERIFPSAGKKEKKKSFFFTQLFFFCFIFYLKSQN